MGIVNVKTQYASGFSQLSGFGIEMPTVDGDASGNVTNIFSAGYTTAIGDCVTIDSAGLLQKTDANTAALYNGMIGIALEVKASGNACYIALPGAIVYSTAFPTLTIGTRYWVSETAGAITGTMPTTGTSGQVQVGVGVHADKLLILPSLVITVSGA